MDCGDLAKCQKETPEKFTACVDDDCHHCEDCFKSPQAATEAVSAELPCCTALVAEGKGCWILVERNKLLALTRTMECHPEDYDGPCECQTCASYGD